MSGSGGQVLMGVPLWSDDRQYDYTSRLSCRGWAWEFLRRNSDFGDAWRSCQIEYGIAGYDAGMTMLLSQHDQPRLAERGLLYCSAPDRDALTATVFWSSDLCSSVLRLTAFPLSAQIDATPFLLRDISCPSVLPRTGRHRDRPDDANPLRL